MTSGPSPSMPGLPPVHPGRVKQKSSNFDKNGKLDFRNSGRRGHFTPTNIGQKVMTETPKNSDKGLLSKFSN